MFHSKVRRLSRIYNWQHAVFPLAIDYNTEITTGTHTDFEGWVLPQHWVDQYCSPLWVLQNQTAGSRKRAASYTCDHANLCKENVGEVRRNFNSKGCSYQDCSRGHKCSDCNAKDHRAHACTCWNSGVMLS